MARPAVGEALAAVFEVCRGRLRIVSGERSHEKIVELDRAPAGWGEPPRGLLN